MLVRPTGLGPGCENARKIVEQKINFLERPLRDFQERGRVTLPMQISSIRVFTQPGPKEDVTQKVSARQRQVPCRHTCNPCDRTALIIELEYADRLDQA